MGVQLTRLLLALIWFSLLVALPAHAQWTNEPPGSTPINDMPFNCVVCNAWVDYSGSTSIVSDATAPLSPSNVMRQTFPAGLQMGFGGGGGNAYNFPQRYNDVYFGYWFKVVPGYKNNAAGTKISWIHTDESLLNELFLFMEGMGPFSISAQYQNTYADNSHLGGPVPNGSIRFAPSGGSFNAGDWVKIEQYFKPATCLTCQDGVWKLWVNGTLTVNITTLNTKSTTKPGAVSYITIWGGSGGPDLDTTSYLYYDHAHVSIPNCGGSCGGSGDTTAPSQVTGLGVSMNGTAATLTWTSATDNVGVTGYLAEKCTPHGCSNWELGGTTSSLSITLTGLTAGVSYDFRVRATDAAGNLGAYSATVTGNTTGEVERTLATDNFDRANGALGANWTGSYSGRPDLTIVSNAVRGSSTSGDNLMAYTAIATPADQWAKADVTITGSAIYAGGVTLRTAASPLASYYMCRLQANAWAGTMIEKLVNGSYTLLASSAAASWLTGDTLKCTARGSTITLSRIRGGVETVMLTATDGTHTTGKPGIITYTSTLPNMIFDNFTTGDWAVAEAPPEITALTTDATGATVTWSGSPAYIRVQTYTASGIFADVVEPIANFPAGRYSQVWAVGITSGCFFAQDASHVENTNPSSYRCLGITPNPPSDTTPAVISNALPSGVLNIGTTSTQLSVTTNENAFCHWDTVDVSYNAMANVFTTAPGGTTHSATKTGLSNGTSYTLYVRCSDSVNNMNPTSTTISFSVDSAPAADSTAPSTVTGLSCVAISTSQIQCAWNAATDNVSVAGYRLYACATTGCSNYSLVASPAGTSSTVAGLPASTVYRFVVDAIDTSQNVSAAHSTAVEVSTSTNLDIVPPYTMLHLIESAPATYTTVSLAWDEGTDNVAISQALLERCAGSTCEDFQTIRSASGTTLSDSTVRFGTTYRYRGKHRDTSGNVSTSYSEILTVQVPNPPVGVTVGVCPCKTH